MESVLGADASVCLGYGKDSGNSCAGDSSSVEETICSKSLLNNVDVTHDIGHKSCWDAMSRYFEFLASTSAVTNEARPSSADFKFVHSVICQAGVQGLSMDEVSEALKIKGEKVIEMFVDTLEVFQLAAKVNAFDSVKVVDASHISKYFISLPGHVKLHKKSNDLNSCTNPQDLSSGTPGAPFHEHHDNVDNSLGYREIVLHSENKTNACAMSSNPSEYHTEGQHFGENTVIVEESNGDASIHVQPNVVGSVINPFSAVEGVFRPILPWISGDGNINTHVYKGLTRRVLGIVMQNPCILEEDIITKMDVLNPQSCRRLLETMVLDNHIKVRLVHQTASTVPPPNFLQGLFPSSFNRPTLKLQKHYFANLMSTKML